MSDGTTGPTRTVTLRPDDLGASAFNGARLHVVHPPDLARVVPIGREPLVLGRGVDGPGRVAHGTLSREHLRVGWDGRMGSWAATDLGSHNGSWLDGGRLEGAPVAVPDGSVLRLGGVVAVLEVSPSDEPTGGEDLAERIPGESRAVRALRSLVARAAADPSPALVIGETGVGKEHVARALHDLGRRRGAFVAVNVSELSAQLVESQLFGHVRGAFTGAERSNDGLFVAAHGGTLFLDEIGELPLELQPKLLRVLQEREVRPVGSTRPQRVDVRVVAATNRELTAEVAKGTFRRDLYARLALWELPVPPLRDRRADVLGWIDRFATRWAAERGVRPRRLGWSPEAVEALLLCPWPENLRGIDRLVHQVAHEAGDAPIPLAAVRGLLVAADPDTTEVTDPGDVETPIKRAAPTTREELEAALARCDGSVRALAKWYGRDRRQIYRWLDAFGIPREP